MLSRSALNCLPTTRAAPRGRWHVVAALLLAMVLLQTLGLVHQVLHAGGPHATAGLVDRSGAFSHSDESECRLFDQLAQGDLAWFAPPTAAPAPALRSFAPALSAGRLAAQAAGYLARGPPRA